MKIDVVIPALNPDDKLIQLISEITSTVTLLNIIKQIIIVDDGSDKLHKNIFNELTLHYPELTILHHPTNRGKGAALKTAFSYIQNHLSDVDGVATMDSDGQHTVAALQSCVDKFSLNTDRLIIGVRHFTNNIPFRSQFGNLLTSGLVRILTRQNISDTQTGLRIIPIAYTANLIDFPGNRFEFEFDMLLQAKKYDIQVVEQPIPTIYLDGNASSHFRVIRDSIAIYSRFLKFAASGLISFLIDISLFYLVLFILNNNVLNSIMIATIVSRVLSSIANYMINHQVVFNNAGHQTLIKYAILFVAQMFASGFFTDLLTTLLPATNGPIMPTIAKMIVDFILFMVSYRIQSNFIFKEGPQNV
ncbi:bifunctional glycosyltransferase family 2/GtrA family protein [Companilactobacillus nantensis]|uniref:bifunctional glycosyltransferase family 2/GtrA family protein n=1 Tax=Companilactobacillus nantensis TaxID=305793 RepID=UPI000A4DAB58|nr:bifunctional glycosyltransferase family 2/GtrA family protein [Companilactobacillus nantensis]